MDALGQAGLTVYIVVNVGVLLIGWFSNINWF